jgi:hypothetical protein
MEDANVDLQGMEKIERGLHLYEDIFTTITDQLVALKPDFRR